MSRIMEVYADLLRVIDGASVDGAEADELEEVRQAILGFRDAAARVSGAAAGLVQGQPAI